MKIVCDICGGDLVIMAAGKGGICKICGMQHSIERIREMLGGAEKEAGAVKKPTEKIAEENIKERAVPGSAKESVFFEEVEIVEEETHLTETDESDFVLKKRFGTVELKEYRGHAQRVIFPDHHIEIQNCHIFEGHDEIVELVFRGGFSNTGCECGIFAGLKNLKRIICNGDMLAYDGEFKNCVNLEEVRITDASLIQLNGAVFSDCVNLKKIVLDENAQMEVGQDAFKNCRSLESFVHPNASIYFTGDGIGTSAFEGCSSLRNVVLADDTTAIHKNAFKDCSSLESVTTRSGDLSSIAIHPDAFAGALFTADNAGVCPQCGRRLTCTDNAITCNCGFESSQYE